VRKKFLVLVSVLHWTL